MLHIFQKSVQFTLVAAKQAHISYEAKTARDHLVAIGTFVGTGTFRAHLSPFGANLEPIWSPFGAQ